MTDFSAPTADTIDDLRGALGDLGTVVWVVTDAAGAFVDCVADPDDVVGRAYDLGSEGLALIRPTATSAPLRTADAAVLRDYLADVLRVTQPSTV